jgi:hypothetical protein
MSQGHCERPSKESMVRQRGPNSCCMPGDISHLSKPEEFDPVDQILKSAKPKDIFLYRASTTFE